MRILDRYLIREFLVPLVYCLAAFVLVYIIYDLSAHLDDYIDNRIPPSVLLNYYLVQMPLVMVNIIPLSILLAIVYCLGALSRHNEITAMRANGLSVFRIIAPFLGMGFVFTLLLFLLNENFAPTAYERSERLIEEHRADKEKGRMAPLAFFNPIDERSWAGQWQRGGESVSDVTVRTLRNRQVVEKVTAKKGSFLDGEWWFFDGATQAYDEKGRLRGKEDLFSKRRFPFKEKPEDFLSSQKDSLSMSYRELARNMAFYPPDSDIYWRKLVDLRHKLSRPFVGVTIVLIAFPLSIRTSRGGAAGSVGMCIALGIIYYVLEVLSLSMGRGGYLVPWLAAWFPNMICGAIGCALIYRSR